MAIDPRTAAGVAQIARLARLDLSEHEAGALGEHLGRILDWVGELDDLDTEGVPTRLDDAPAADLRPDLPAPSLSREQALGNAPKAGLTGFVVPAVLSE
jgi:aspartyl-tRNA(Asn)/glutamyl-tRNA(Gln) amidotransferase subunit C